MSAVARIVVVGAPPPTPDPGIEALAAALDGAGVPVTSRIVVEDDDAALERAVADGDLVVVLAGAGSSAGDAVRRVLARAAGTRLALNERMLAALTAAHERRDRPLPRRAERLALLPLGAVLWPAGDGEPAWTLETAERAVVVLPRGGVPRALIDSHLVPLARARAAARGAAVTRTLRAAGVGVDEVEERLAAWLGRDGDVTVTVVPAEGEVWVRLRCRAAVAPVAAEQLAAVEREVAGALGEDCYGRDGEALEQVVGWALRDRGLTVAVAESCTGGLLGHRLTAVPGSSVWFERGVMVYSNRAKEELLGVPESVLRAHGAVSAPCAEAMVRGIRRVSGAACGLAVTGIAGPDGGTPQKPVGTVFIGIAIGDHVDARRFLFAGDRASVKWQSAQMALDMLRRGVVARGGHR